MSVEIYKLLLAFLVMKLYNTWFRGSCEEG